MKAFRRSGAGVAWRCSTNEVTLLTMLTEQFLELVEPPQMPDPDDWMAVLQAELDTEPLDREDPAILRLFPSAYPDDIAADDEFRSLTEPAMRRAKATDARAVLSALAAAGDDVPIAAGDVAAWLRTTNALRLVLGARLGIDSAAAAESVDLVGEDHPAFAAVEIYQWLGYVQTALLDVL